jgi:hypothetical protein
MSFHQKLALIQEMIDNAMSSIRSAQTLLSELTGQDSSNALVNLKLSEVQARNQEADIDAPFYEGVFNGEKMVTPEGEEFSVPANYASKSKLVPGDELKLIIAADGRFIYKQIGPAPRRHILGTVIREDNRYKVIGEGKAYQVLTAAVTYYKAEVGDKVTLVVPENSESKWGAIDNVIPDLEKVGGEDLELDSEVF